MTEKEAIEKKNRKLREEQNQILKDLLNLSNVVQQLNERALILANQVKLNDLSFKAIYVLGFILSLYGVLKGNFLLFFSYFSLISISRIVRDAYIFKFVKEPKYIIKILIMMFVLYMCISKLIILL